MYCENVPDRFSDSMVDVFPINSEIISPPSSPMKFPRNGGNRIIMVMLLCMVWILLKSKSLSFLLLIRGFKRASIPSGPSLLSMFGVRTGESSRTMVGLNTAQVYSLVLPFFQSPWDGYCFRISEIGICKISLNDLLSSDKRVLAKFNDSPISFNFVFAINGAKATLSMSLPELKT